MTGPNLHLDDTEGCTFVGIFFSLILYGTTLAQTSFYLYHYPSDPRFFKLLVAGLWLLDTVKEAVTLQILYFVFVQGHSDILSLLKLPITYGAEHALAAATILVVQCFYIHNIWKMLTKNRVHLLLPIIGFLFALISFAASLAVVYGVYGNADLVAAETHIITPGRVQASFALVTDVYISVSLCFVLQGWRTGFGPTQSVVSKLTSYAINRGIILTILQLLQVATNTTTKTEVDQVFYFPSSTVYVNSVLAVLNARMYLRGESLRYAEFVLPSRHISVTRTSTSLVLSNPQLIPMESVVLDIR